MTIDRAELRAMLVLATPLVLAELGWMAMGIEDTMFVGRIGAEAIGAISVGTTIFYTIAILGGGLLLGLDTLISQAAGAGDVEDRHRSLVNGAWLALALIPIVMLAVRGMLTVLAMFGVSPGVLRQVVPYMRTVSTTFMLPLGVSSAAAVRVGNAIGRGDPKGAAQSGWTALGVGAAIMSMCGIVLLLVPQVIARLFTPDVVIIAAAVPLLRLAAFFQLFDGLQVVTTGALRGAGDTATPMICHIAGYGIIGLPLGAVLCFREGMGAIGLWIGLSTGLILIGIALAIFWRGAARKIASTIPAIPRAS